MFVRLQASPLFSFNALILLVIAAFLAWILKGYPEWRRKRIQRRQENAEAIEHSANGGNTSTSATRAEANKSTVDKVVEETRSSAKLSVAHYVLAMPLATAYICSRVFIDCLRALLYWLLWSMEQAAPKVDAWLFDKVTVWLPAKVDQCESWWNNQGVHLWQAAKAYMVQKGVPATIRFIDNSFMKAAYALRMAYDGWNELRMLWQRLLEQRDWRQFALDLVVLWTDFVWKPSVWLAARLYRIVFILFVGMHRVSRSIADDVIWLSNVAIPEVLKILKNTRLYQRVHRGLHWTLRLLRVFAIGFSKSILLPCITGLHHLFTRLSVSIAALMKSNTFMVRVKRIRRLVLSHMVWLVLDLLALTVSAIAISNFLTAHLVIPVYSRFVEDALPLIVKAYTRLRDKMWDVYQHYIVPACIKLFPSIREPIAVAFTFIVDSLSRPYRIISIYLSTVSSRMYNWLRYHGSHVLEASFRTVRAAVSAVVAVLRQILGSIQATLVRQAPLLAKAVRQVQELLTMYDWKTFGADFAEHAATLGTWVSAQAELFFASLERSLTNWIKENTADTTKDDTKKNN